MIFGSRFLTSERGQVYDEKFPILTLIKIDGKGLFFEHKLNIVFISTFTLHQAAEPMQSTNLCQCKYLRIMRSNISLFDMFLSGFAYVPKIHRLFIDLYVFSGLSKSHYLLLSCYYHRPYLENTTKEEKKSVKKVVRWRNSYGELLTVLGYWISFDYYITQIDSVSHNWFGLIMALIVISGHFSFLPYSNMSQFHALIDLPKNISQLLSYNDGNNRSGIWDTIKHKSIERLSNKFYTSDFGSDSL